MKESHRPLSYEAAKNILIAYVQAFIAPYEPADSEEVEFYFPLIPIIQISPYSDRNALCDLDEIFESFIDYNLDNNIDF